MTTQDKSFNNTNSTVTSPRTHKKAMPPSPLVFIREFSTFSFVFRHIWRVFSHSHWFLVGSKQYITQRQQRPGGRCTDRVHVRCPVASAHQVEETAHTWGSGTSCPPPQWQHWASRTGGRKATLLRLRGQKPCNTMEDKLCLVFLLQLSSWNSELASIAHATLTTASSRIADDFLFSALNTG